MRRRSAQSHDPRTIRPSQHGVETILRRRVQVAAIAYLLLLGLAYISELAWARHLAGLAGFFVAPGLFLTAISGIGRESAALRAGLVLTLSPAVSVAVLYILADLGGLPPGAATSGVLATGAALAAFVLLPHGNAVPARSPSEGPDPAPQDRWLVVGFLLLLVLVSPLIHTRIQLSHHGLYHASIVAAIGNGALPPMNPGYWGAPIDTYWHFHLFLAGVVEGARVSPLVASTVLRVASLVAVFLLAGVLAGRARIPSPWLAGVFAIFCVNLASPLLALGSLPESLELLWAGGLVNPSEVTNPVLMGDPRAADGLTKFLNFNAFGYAIAAWVGALALIGSEATPKGARATGLFFLSVAAVSFHMPSSVALLLILPLATLLAPLVRSGAPPSFGIGFGLRTMAPFALAAAFTAPYWIGILNGYAGPVVGTDDPGIVASSLPLLIHNLHMFLGAYWPLIPVLALTPFAFRSMSQEEARLFLSVVGCLVLTVLLTLPGGNQYKFVLLAAVPVGVVAASEVSVRLAQMPRLRSFFLLTGLFLALLHAALVVVGYYRSAWWADHDFASSGTTLEYAPSGAYAFLRQRTPVTTIVLEAPVPLDASPTGAVAERQSYILISPWGYFRGLPDYDERLSRVARIMGEEEGGRDALAEIATEVDRPLAVVLDRRVLGVRYDEVRQALGELRLTCEIFQDPGGTVLGVGELCGTTGGATANPKRGTVLVLK